MEQDITHLLSIYKHELTMQSGLQIQQLKCRRGSDECDTDIIPAEQKAAGQDTYGCIKWDMTFMPLTETTVSQQQKKLKMKFMSEQANFNPDEVKTLMKCTYYSQSKAINLGTDLLVLGDDWPFLFRRLV